MIPRVAIVGRPNVGKSTLLNRAARRRVSIVHDRPGITRDRVAVELEWRDTCYELVDTGGIGLIDEQDLEEAVHRQIEAAIEGAALVLFLVDCRSGLEPLDEQVAARLRRLSIPRLLVANKCESRDSRHTLGEFHRLGLGEPFPISALHGEGVAELIETVGERLPAGASREEPELLIGIVGRRNAGKSTFVNALLREERVIASEIPGTTRDAVDVRFTKDGRSFVLIDTAGIQRRRRLRNAVEHYAQARALQAIRRADVVLFLIDAEQGVAQIDKRIAHEIVESHTVCVLIVNKWDLVRGKAGTEEFERYLARVLPGLHYAPCVFTSARGGRNVWDAIGVAQSLAKQASREVGTGRINRALDVIRAEPHRRGKGGKEPKIYYGVQVGVLPPAISLFVNRPQLFSQGYRRAIENRLRELLPFEESPIRVLYRPRGRGEP